MDNLNNVDLNNNFNIAEMQAQIYGLPTDVQGYMLSFVNGFDSETLKSVNLVSKLWHNTIQTLSRQLADRYFPYLEITQPEAYANNPLKLLSDECKRYLNMYLKCRAYDNRATLIPMDLILHALSGNKAAIEAEKNQQIKMMAFILFFANAHGNASSLEGCGFNEEDTRHIMKQALEYATQNGYLKALPYLLNTVGIKDYSHYCVSDAFIDASKKGHLHIIKYILTTEMTAVLKWTCDEDHRLSYCYAQENALYYAAINGHLPVVQYLLTVIGPHLETSSQKIILRDTDKNGHFDIIQAINGWDLRMTAVQGDISKIQALLTNQKPGEEISSEDKGLALIMAAQYGHLDIMEILLQQAGKEIPLEYKEGALDILENTDGNNNAQKTNLITLLQMHTLTEQMMADFTPAPMFAPNYQAVGESDLSLKRKHDGSEEENRDTKKRKGNPECK